MPLRLAIQKSGRLANKTLQILGKCDFEVDPSGSKIRQIFPDFPLEVLLIRDDDIPAFVHEGASDLGIVGWNEVAEFQANASQQQQPCYLHVEYPMGFSKCRLSLAVPESTPYDNLQWFQGKKIATSYPGSLRKYLSAHKISCEVYRISGSVESAPAVGLSAGICDLVATGASLMRHHLKEVETLFHSEAVLISHPQRLSLSSDKRKLVELLKQRVISVLKAERSRYIMFHAPSASLKEIITIVPGMETPTVIPLTLTDGPQTPTPSQDVAVHVVASEPIFWSTLEKLRQAGARSIVVLPIETMME